MADKSIEQLTAAERVYASDLFVLQQSGTAKKLTGQVLENWLLEFADGHGGIQSIVPAGSSGLVDTYRLTMADTTTFDFTVANGRSIVSIQKTGTSGLTDTYTVTYNDKTTSTFIVTNGAKGDKGDATYTWVRYASQQPTEASHNMGTVPDDWRGEYVGPLAEAPTDWKQYTWFKIKGDKGDTGSPSKLTGSSVTYLASDSGTIVPSGSWSSTVPTVGQGRYLWTRVVQTFNTGSPVTYYSVSRMGVDGSGAVSTVNGQSPDSNGNVKLTATDIQGSTGQSVAAELAGKADKTQSVTVTLTVAGWSGGVQTVGADGVTLDGDVLVSPAPESLAAYLAAGIWCKSQQTEALIFGCKTKPTAAISVVVKPM